MSCLVRNLTGAVVIFVLSLAIPLAGQTPDLLSPHSATLNQVVYEGRSAIQLIADPGAPNGTSYAIVKGAKFKDGTIEINLAGKPAAGASGGARGFIGMAFRLQDGKFEYIYLRPTNGRADDQVRRNHSTQYSSHPDFDFAASRLEAPGKYESYVDLQTGAWTKFKIEIDGRNARLYVHNAEQPALIVHGMKLEPAEGGVAIWVGPETEGYFEGLRITPKPAAVASKKIYFDRAHGEFPWPAEMVDVAQRSGFSLESGTDPITPQALAASRLVYLRAPNKAFDASEKQAVISFVKAGGSLLLVLDEEQRQKLAVVGANDLIEPFGLKLSGDTPHIDNTGAIAKAGEINRSDREVPYDGGREVFGGTAFAYQLNREGHAAQPYASYVKLDNGGRVVVMGEGMASLFLGTPDGTRLTVDPKNPKWWGKDSSVFMEEVVAWLVAR